MSSDLAATDWESINAASGHQFCLHIRRGEAHSSSVNVVIPCYNCVHYLGNRVRALNQRNVDVRVLIVDDASPDSTPAAASQLASDRGVLHVRNEINLGLIGTANRTCPNGTIPRTFVTCFDSGRIFLVPLSGAYDAWERRV